MKSTHASRQFASMKDSIRDGEYRQSSVSSDDRRRFRRIPAKPLTVAEKAAIAASDAAQALISAADSAAHFARLAAVAAEADAAMSANVQIVADFFAGKTAPASTKEMRSSMYAAGITVASPGAIFSQLFAR